MLVATMATKRRRFRPIVYPIFLRVLDLMGVGVGFDGSAFKV